VLIPTRGYHLIGLRAEFFSSLLGFKGSWRRSEGNELIEKLKSVRQTIEQNRALAAQVIEHLVGRKFIVDAACISDSVAISVRYEQSTGDNDLAAKGALVWLVAAACALISELFARGRPSFALRGCITYGQHDCDNTFVIGPAVDEAAELSTVPQGAFIWLTPAAAGYYQALAMKLVAAAPALATDAEFLEFINEAARVVPGSPVSQAAQVFQTVAQHALGALAGC
jgi:hypothetical protein